MREIQRQQRYDLMPVPEQIAVMAAVIAGVFDGVPTEEVTTVEARFRESISERYPEICRRIMGGQKLSEEDIELLVQGAREAVEQTGD